jgi:hypothetical protein
MVKSVRKRVLCETGLDPDSGDELDIDIGTVVNSQGRGASSRHVHVAQAPPKRAKSGPSWKPSNTPADAVGDVPAAKEKRKQVSINLLFNMTC